MHALLPPIKSFLGAWVVTAVSDRMVSGVTPVAKEAQAGPFLMIPPPDVAVAVAVDRCRGLPGEGLTHLSPPPSSPLKPEESYLPTPRPIEKKHKFPVMVRPGK